MVATGILLSRIIGLVRNRVFAHYFGTSDAADAFNAAFRIPNFLQNLFGEGVLSASFIPVYARLRARATRARMRRATAAAVAALLALTVSVLVLAGVLLAPWLIDRHRSGLRGREARGHHPAGADSLPGRGTAGALRLVSRRAQQPPAVLPLLRRAGGLEPGDHRGAARQGGRGRTASSWRRSPPGARWWAACSSSPSSFRPCSGCSAGFDPGRCSPSRCGRVVRTFLPVFVGRGVVQISAYVDTLLASLLPTGAVAAVSYAQVLYTLPVSLFGMSVSAAELPEMSSATGTEPSARRISAAARGGAAADRVPRDSVGGGVHRAGRRGDRCALPVGRVHPRDDGVRLGHPRGGVGGPAAVHARPALLLGVLRAARHPDAAPDRAGAGEPRDRPRATRWRSTCRPAAGVDPRLGSRGDHARLGARGRRGIPPAARAPSAGRIGPTRLDGGTLARLWVAAVGRQRASAWAVAARCRTAASDRGRGRSSWAFSGRCIWAAPRCWACRRRGGSALRRRLASGRPTSPRPTRR